MGKENINERDIVFFVLSNKNKFPAEKLEKEVLRATKDFDILEKGGYKGYISNVLNRLVNLGLLNEITERSGSERNLYYSITKKGKKAYNRRFAEIIKKGDESLHRRIEEYFHYIVYE